MSTAIVFACDEPYMPFAKGLVLSLQESLRYAGRAGTAPDLHFIDIGCKASSLDWLRVQGVRCHPFSRNSFLQLPDAVTLPRYANAQLCRPFLPRIVPGYDQYVWIDTDIWVQGHDAVTGFLEALAAAHNYMVICPEHHYGYSQRSMVSAVSASHEWYSALYDAATADRLCGKPVLNSGFFALNGASPLWEQWAAALAAVYSKSYESSSVLHLAEQLSLNRLLYETGAFILLDPVHNYACGASAVLRNLQGKMVVGYPPYTAIKGVHLLAFRRYGKEYLRHGFFYRRGDYLSQAEKISLEAMAE